MDRLTQQRVGLNNGVPDWHKRLTSVEMRVPTGSNVDPRMRLSGISGKTTSSIHSLKDIADSGSPGTCDDLRGSPFSRSPPLPRPDIKPAAKQFSRTEPAIHASGPKYGLSSSMYAPSTSSTSIFGTQNTNDLSYPVMSMMTGPRKQSQARK